ncbi:MAG: TetR/AcrR family transcriptional regulator [Verrucomicrobiales bacterium]|nr:TetR/AcrR family transcriptional regulator [Verrucomicrobiales bacterium]
METATRLFQERGFSEVGINEIIEKAETAKASFYQHFKSKTDLCEAWLQTIHERSEEIRSEILDSAGDPVDKIVSYFEGIEPFLKANDFRGCPYSNTAAVVDSGCCGIRGKIESHKDSIRQFFRQLTGEFARSGERASQLADQLFLLFSGATSESQNLRATWPARTACRAAREICEAERDR